MTNRVMSGIVSAIVFFSAAAFSVTAEENITVKLNGQTLSFDVQPQIINDRTMVPLRTIFEALGANVDWNESNRSITATKDDTTIKLAVDNNIMYVNDETVTLDSPACIVDGRNSCSAQSGFRSAGCFSFLVWRHKDCGHGIGGPL